MMDFEGNWWIRRKISSLPDVVPGIQHPACAGSPTCYSGPARAEAHITHDVLEDHESDH